MFYLMIHSTHLWLHDIKHMVNDYSGSKRVLSDQQQGIFYMHHPKVRIVHTTAFDTAVAEHWLEQEWIDLTDLASAGCL